MNWRFEEPWFLLLLLLPMALLWWRSPRGGAGFGAWLLAARVLRPSRRPLLHRLLVVAGLAALVVALARPQYGRSITIREHSGRDIMLLIDLSASMVADDMFDVDDERIDRLAAVITAAKDFVRQRPSDRLGLVFFASTALTSCPLTLDHEAVIGFLDGIEAQQRRNWRQRDYNGLPKGLLGPGTNTGLGIASALAYLEEDAEAGKAMVLITDGRDSRRLPNWVDPMEAALQADRLAVRIHAIGVGDRNGTMTDLLRLARTGERRLMGLPPEFLPDMPRLQAISEASGGVAMHANDRQELKAVFDEIDRLEPSTKAVRSELDYADRFLVPLALGLALLGLAWVAEPALRGVP